MAIYSFRIVGVHYAVNPDSNSHAEETELMHQRTAQRLRELDDVRPTVVLIPEPSNPADTRAVMARVDGGRIGYVDKTQLDTVHALFQANGGRPLMARIESVEAKKHGWMMVQMESKEEVRVEPQNQCGSVWENWMCTLPVLPTIESQFAMMEAEAMLEDALSKSTIESIERYIRLWLDNSLHDLSHEARLMREHYIMRLKELPSQIVMAGHEPLPRIKVLVSALEKQRTAICGQKRMNLRINGWWKELLASKEMEQLWKTWVARMGDNMEQSMPEMDILLRTLPNDLYGFLDDKKLFFSRLYYSHVPRDKYWQVVSLMLLRERMKSWGNETFCQVVWGSETRPQVVETVNETFTVEEEKFEVIIPKELQTPEANKILTKLQKKGILDEDLQPSTLKGWQKGILAYELAGRFDIKHTWVEMGKMWKCNPKTLRQYYSKEFAEDKAVEFAKNIKAIIH